MNVLISGINNYVGRRCAGLMADEDCHLFAITRNKELLEERISEPLRAKIVELDLLKEDAVLGAVGLPRFDASFYFAQAPTVDDPVNAGVELLCLRNFVHLIRKLQCNRLVYVAKLMDRKFLKPVLDLLKELQVDYTVVLKGLIVGKNCLIYNIYQRLIDKSVVFYPKICDRKIFHPIGIKEFAVWLKAILYLPAFYHRVVEVRGPEAVSALGLYRLYRKLKVKLRMQRLVPLPDWLWRLVYQKRRCDEGEDAELHALMRVEEGADNDWDIYEPLIFSKLRDVLLAE